jgi:hypothetical protein
MTIAEMVGMIRSTVKGNAMLSIECETEPNMRKTDNPFHGNVVKRQKLNGMIGFDYEGGVNRLAAKEGKEAREAQPRKWGFLTADRLFVCKFNDGNPTHIRMRVMQSIDPRYFSTVDGTEVAKVDLLPFMPVKKKSSTQADLEGEVIERDITLENVKVLHFNGETYRITPETMPTIAPESETPAMPAPAVPAVPAVPAGWDKIEA